MTEIIGMIAGVLTTMSFIPQVIKVLKTNDTKSISLMMYSIFSTGVALWLAYGILIESPSIIISNSITLPLTIIILFKKIKNQD
ncbi:MAG: SemiSWEET transporter [Rickettsiales bacterium]|nr:SemiSWEET transporter [Rickettsiales bacterium]